MFLKETSRIKEFYPESRSHVIWSTNKRMGKKTHIIERLGSFVERENAQEHKEQDRMLNKKDSVTI